MICSFFDDSAAIEFSCRFSRRTVQTFYPPASKKGRPNRLCSSLGEKIAELKNEAEGIQRTIVEKNGQKSKLVNDRHDLEQKITNSKVKFLLMCNAFQLSGNLPCLLRRENENLRSIV